MKVLHIHSSDGGDGRSGAEVALARLHHGLLAAGAESKILCKHVSRADVNTTRIKRSLPTRLAESVLNRTALHAGLNEIAFYSAFGIPRLPEYKWADVIHLHVMHGSYFSYLALPRLCRSKPVLFTMHDMWALTGHCTVTHDCERWKTGCGRCPYPDEYPSIRRDLTRFEWKLKQRVYERSSLVVHAVSRAQESTARASMLSRFPMRMIHHGIDMEAHKPLDQAACREVLSIPEERFVLLFAAADMDRSAKGLDLLRDALRGLPQKMKDETTLLILGEGNIDELSSVGMNMKRMGFVGNDELKAILFSASDAFVMPSRGESFGLVALESMACGTPVVAFAVGGLVELVRSEETGFLARPENVDEFRAGVVRMWRDDAARIKMGARCREVAVNEFSDKQKVAEFMALYREMRANATLGGSDPSGAP